MSKIAWQALLTALDHAGKDYTRLHRAVTALLISRGGGSDSERLADVTLDRVAQKIHKGEDVRSPVSYSKKVADLVWREYCREREKFRNATRELAHLNTDVYELEQNTNLRRKCQEACINKLSESERQLVVDYYITAKDREALAAELGIGIATLRTQIHRLKRRLTKCVEDCRRSA